MRTLEELMESKEVRTYIFDVRSGYLDINEEIEYRLENNWLEPENMICEGEYIVNSGDYIVMDGLTERESNILWDGIIGELEEIKLKGSVSVG